MLAAFFSVFSGGPVEARFGGSYNALYEAVGSPQSIVRSEPSVTPSMEEFISIAQGILPDADVHQMRIIGYGDRNAIISVRASRPGDLGANNSGLLVNIRASTGEILLKREVDKAGVFERISVALTAFHVASYGGAGIRRLHAITALIISLMPYIGMAIWFLRRQRRRKTVS